MSIKPQDIRPGTHQKYWWKCPKCEYEWLASPNNRTNHNSKCPNCTRGASILKKIEQTYPKNLSVDERINFVLTQTHK